MEIKTKDQIMRGDGNYNKEWVAIDDLKKVVSRMYDEDGKPVWGILVEDISIDLTSTKQTKTSKGD